MSRVAKGKVYRHPNHERPIYVQGGDWEIDGRISNFWYWREINEDGTLGDLSHGYAIEEWEEIEDVIIHVRVEFL